MVKHFAAKLSFRRWHPQEAGENDFTKIPLFANYFPVNNLFAAGDERIFNQKNAHQNKNIFTKQKVISSSTIIQYSHTHREASPDAHTKVS